MSTIGKRGLGTGAALIDAVADLAREAGARPPLLDDPRNATQPHRKLYDRITERSGTPIPSPCEMTGIFPEYC